MSTATIKFTALNPYWQVPSDLAAERVGVREPHGVGLRVLLETLRRKHLQEPQPGGERDEHQRDQQREHAKARRSSFHQKRTTRRGWDPSTMRRSRG